jgi:cellulose biosynthesis protein BcsQ
LAIGSHKGGTGRTTTACALAWLWGREGFQVTLADADPVHAAGLIALDDSGVCRWPNVAYRDELPVEQLADGDSLETTCDIVVIDCPSLIDDEVQSVLQHCHGVVLTCLADPLSLRTVPAAAGVLAMARSANPRLELLGVLIAQYRPEDPMQAAMLERLRHMHGELLLEPPTPYVAAVRDWAHTPGAALPEGQAAETFAAAGKLILETARRRFRVAIAPVSVGGRA